MKNLSRLIIVCALAISGLAGAGAQTTEEDFTEAIDQLMDVSFQSDSLGLAKTTEALRRFTDETELAYLAHYYIAFGKWQSVLRQLTGNAVGEAAVQLLDEAIAELDTVIALKADFADAYALSLNCHYPIFYLAPERREDVAARITALRKRALELGPDNPRVVLTDAQNIFYTPEEFGGSQEKGMARYRQAIRLFEEQPPPETPHLPQWGHEIAYAWLGNAYLMKQEPDTAKAKAAFEKALKLRPDFAWVKDTMMPQLDKD